LFWRARVVWDVSNFDLKQRCVFGRAFNLGIDQATIHIRTKQQSSHSIDQPTISHELISRPTQFIDIFHPSNTQHTTQQVSVHAPTAARISIAIASHHKRP
jgi:hypothetical protein